MQSYDIKMELKSTTKYNYQTRLNEFFVYDQFSDGMQPLINENKTAQSICGYTAVANAIVAAKLMNQNIIVEQIIQRLSDVQEVYFSIEKVMKQIQKSRSSYVAKNNMKGKKAQGYISDWVANYEISDYLRQEDRYLTENIWFFRNVAYDHPEEMAKSTHEELDRLPEEKRFQGQGFFFECFHPKRELMSINEFQQLWQLSESKESQIFIIDLLGHYNVVLCARQNQQFLISMCDTTRNNYIEKKAFQMLVQILS